MTLTQEIRLKTLINDYLAQRFPPPDISKAAYLLKNRIRPPTVATSDFLALLRENALPDYP